MNYQIPTEEIENIRRSNNGIILLNYEKKIEYKYNDMITNYNFHLHQIYVKWFFRRSDKTLGIESLYGEANSRKSFMLILQILKSITLLKNGDKLGGNITNTSLKKILPKIGFIEEGETNFYLYKDKF